MKFKDAFCTKLYREITIEEATLCYQNNKKEFIENIKDFLICPECKKPKLIYNNANPPYFNVYPKATHEEWCTLKQDELSPKQVEKFLKNPDNRAAINRQMGSLLTMLLKENTVNISQNKDTLSTQIFPDRNCIHLKPVISKRIPRKKIDTFFRPEDFGHNKLFYGNVHLKWEEAGKDNKYKILLYHLKTKKLILKLFVSLSVLAHIPENYKSPNEYDCAIVFIANIKEDSGRTYQYTNLCHSEALILQKL